MKQIPILLCLMSFVFSPGFSQEKQQDPAPQAAPDFRALIQALQTNNVDEVLRLTDGATGKQLKEIRADVLHSRGVKRFFKGDIEGSVSDFDEVITLSPKRDARHWQRGISYYYAGKYQEGKEQFERHQTVNPEDVENAVWHFICSVRAPGGSVESARKNLIPISKDQRVPMKEVHALFAGTGTAEAVLAAAKKVGNPKSSEDAKRAYMYAHLYLALFYEATGKTDLMKKHINLAANEYRYERHYMGTVAVVHAQLRKTDDKVE